MERLEPYRRHTLACPHRAKGRAHTRCSCPVWVDGSIGGHRFNRSTGTRDWQRAMRQIEAWESNPRAAVSPDLAGVVERFLDDCAARHVAASTLYDYRRLLEALVAMAPAQPSDLTTAILSDFRRTRPAQAARTQRKEIAVLRTFCRWCVVREYMTRNPALPIRGPKLDESPTLPFTDDEVIRLIVATDHITGVRGDVDRPRLRARALVLTLLYSGLRISDVANLDRSKLGTDGRLLIRQTKTAGAVYVRLHPDAVDALATLPVESQRYFFRRHETQWATTTGSMRRTLAAVGAIAGVANVHPHRFRDTFSVGLLLRGVPLRTVSLLLGHTSIVTTERHYAPWVREQQRLLDDAVSLLDWGGRKRDDEGGLRRVV